MALTKDYKPGAILDDTADAKERNPRGAGRKPINPNKKKLRYTIAMTNAEHNKAVAVQQKRGFNSLSAALVALVEDAYNADGEE